MSRCEFKAPPSPFLSSPQRDITSPLQYVIPGAPDAAQCRDRCSASREGAGSCLAYILVSPSIDEVPRQ
jgi:hypothetical protein